MSAFLLGKGFRADMGTCIRKLVLLKLIDACEDDGSRIFPAMETVARAAQCSKRQVQREIRAMMEVGLLRLVREGGSGRRSTNEYHMDLAMLDRIAAEGWEAVAGGSEVKGDTVSPLDEAAKGDTGDTDRVTPATPKGDNGSHTTPPDSSLDPSSERARASAEAGEEEDRIGETAEPAEERPEAAAFQKRVMWFCNGKGFHAGPWPDWDTSSPGHIARCFAKLSIEERAAAERWRDAYLLDLKRRKKRPVPVANFIRDRLWTGLDPALLQQAEKARVAQLPAGKQPRPEGWAPFLGPVGMAYLFARYLAGGQGDGHPIGQFYTDTQLKDSWPTIWQFKALMVRADGHEFGERWHRLKPAMEPVPQGSDRLAQWRQAFERWGWPWLHVFDRTEVVYCPRGGPDGLEAFAVAVDREAVREPDRATGCQPGPPEGRRRPESDAAREAGKQAGNGNCGEAAE